MKRILLFSLCALGASAQYAPILTTDHPADSLATLNAKPAMTKAAGVPSGTCTQSLDLYLNTTNGDLYVCSATNTWLKVTGAGSALSAHAATHQNGGGDEVATATPGANAIPKAGAGGTLAAGWIPTLNQNTSGNAATAAALAATPSLCPTGQAPTGILSNGNATGCAAAGGGGSGITTMTTGAADPVASCTAPSTSNLVLYTQTTTQDIWACVAANTWKRVLSTSNTGTYVATGTTGTAPANPAAGNVTCYYSSVSLTQICLDASGNVFSAVKTAASRTANQFVTHVPATGIPATAALAVADLAAMTGLPGVATQFLNGTGAFSTPAGGGGGAGKIYYQSRQAPVVGASGTLFTTTIAGGTIGAGQCIEVNASVLSVVRATGVEYKIIWGATTIPVFVQPIVGQMSLWKFELCNDTGATGTQQLNWLSGVTQGLDGTWNSQVTVPVYLTQDSTASATLALTMTNGAGTDSNQLLFAHVKGPF